MEIWGEGARKYEAAFFGRIGAGGAWEEKKKEAEERTGKLSFRCIFHYHLVPLCLIHSSSYRGVKDVFRSPTSSILSHWAPQSQLDGFVLEHTFCTPPIFAGNSKSLLLCYSYPIIIMLSQVKCSILKHEPDHMFHPLTGHWTEGSEDATCPWVTS